MGRYADGGGCLPSMGRYADGGGMAAADARPAAARMKERLRTRIGDRWNVEVGLAKVTLGSSLLYVYCESY